MWSTQSLCLSLPPSQLQPRRLTTPNLCHFSSNLCRSNVHAFRSRPKSKILTTCSYATTPATDRLISAASYFLPLFNGLAYGRFLFAQYPPLSLPFRPIMPLLSLYHSMPYSSFVSFFALYLGVVRNPNFSRYVRFNALQAIVLDVLLVMPVLVERIFSPGRSGLGFKLMVMSHNAIFVFIISCFIYSLMCTILGKTPYLPFVADAAGRQL